MATARRDRRRRAEYCGFVAGRRDRLGDFRALQVAVLFESF